MALLSFELAANNWPTTSPATNGNAPHHKTIELVEERWRKSKQSLVVASRVSMGSRLSHALEPCWCNEDSVDYEAVA
jgi:hypothetical protein